MYTELSADKLSETAKTLLDRVKERFPDSGLAGVSHELVELAQRSRHNVAQALRPSFSLRFLVGLSILLIIICVGTSVSLTVVAGKSSESLRGLDWREALDLLEKGLSASFFLGAAILFILTLETRVRRRRILGFIHELRCLAHVVDMHQLTKDPEYLHASGKDTASSPKRTMTAFELSRYLDYCSEMLSLIGKITALYIQRLSDPVVLQAVDDVESLTAELSTKIGQKMIVLSGIRQPERESESPS